MFGCWNGKLCGLSKRLIIDELFVISRFDECCRDLVKFLCPFKWFCRFIEVHESEIVNDVPTGKNKDASISKRAKFCSDVVVILCRLCKINAELKDGDICF